MALRGEKVTLRAVERSDLVRIWEIRNDEELEDLTFGPPSPRSLAQIEAQFERALAEPDAESFVIEAAGQVVGRLDLFDVQEVDRTCRTGMSIVRAEHGKGYGTDALRVLVEYCFHHRNLNKVCAEILASNEPSLRMVRAVGFVEEAPARADLASGPVRGPDRGGSAARRLAPDVGVSRR